jgi:ABC-type glycerol-3-phosphate transport system substrate-binding protein
MIRFPLFSSTAVSRDSRGLVLLVPVLALILSACTGAQPQQPPPTLTVTPQKSSQATPAPTPAAAPADGPATLTWWTPEFLSPRAAQPGGLAFSQQMAAFEVEHDGLVRVEAVPKARYGDGGILNLLRSAKPVAPAVLPDIVALDLTELELAAQEGLIQPLDALLDPSVSANLYPFARTAGVFDGKLLAVPYVADIEHAAYLSSQVETPPATWDQLLANQTPYLFPLGQPQPNSSTSATESLQHSVLSQYVSAGGTLDAATRQPKLEVEPLIRLLEFYKAANNSGVLPPGALDLASSDGVWGFYVQGRVPMAYVSARRYLAEREALKGSGFAAAPGWQQPALSVANGWALAIVTPDPERQKLAAEFITLLLEPQNAGNAALAAGWLPTSPDALKTWGDVPYYGFLDGQLRDAVGPPIGSGYADVATRIQKAITSVLKDNISPAEAAQTAVNAR